MQEVSRAAPDSSYEGERLVGLGAIQSFNYVGSS